MIRASIVSDLVHKLDVLFDMMQAISVVIKNVHLDRVESTHLSQVDTSEEYTRLRTALSSFERAFSSSVSLNHGLAPLVAEIRTTCNIAAPVNRIPDEVLSRIFSFVPARRGKRRLSSTLLVASICRHWREVTLQCGSLWAYVDFRRKAENFSLNDPHRRSVSLKVPRMQLEGCLHVQSQSPEVRRAGIPCSLSVERIDDSFLFQRPIRIVDFYDIPWRI